MSDGARGRTVPRWWRFLVVVVLLALLAVACGDDDDDETGDGGAPDTGDVGATDDSVATGDSAEPTTAPVDTTADTEAPSDDEPVAGGEVTILQFNEVATLDPHVLTTSGGSGGQRLFPFYGALVTYVHETQEVVPVIAESMEPSEDFSTWTLTLRAGVTFSDGTPYDAAAVKLNWERIANPETRSPGISVALSIASTTVVDDVTLEIALAAPNAHFDKAISASNLNYVISPQALADGVDLNTETAGAGPYILEEWRHDDRLTMVRNPTYFDAPRPYVDRIEYRIVVDDAQRVDTFDTDDDTDAAWFFNIIQLNEAAAARDAEVVAIQVPNSPVLAVNNAQPPFDDPRVRRAVLLGLDREAFADVTVGEEAEGAVNFVPEDSPWYSPAGDLPDYDPEGAQALFDEVAAETGAPVSFTISGFQNNEQITEYVQTTLNQFDNVEVEHVSNDSATGVGLVIQGDYQMSSWGFPFLDPDPGLYRYANSTQFTDFAKYANPEVDALLDEARLTRDFDERYALYEQVFAHLVEDAAWIPYYHLTCGFSVAPNLHDVEIFEEATLRVDLMWVDQ